MSLSIKASDFRAWARAAEVGADITYLEGSDLYDDTGHKLLPVAVEAQRLANEGLVMLFQRRLSEHTRQYRARRLSKAAGEVLKPAIPLPAMIEPAQEPGEQQEDEDGGA